MSVDARQPESKTRGICLSHALPLKLSLFRKSTPSLEREAQKGSSQGTQNEQRQRVSHTN